MIGLLEEELKTAFQKAGYEDKYGVVTISNRPDLCQFQCNGSMSAVKQYKKAPIQIAGEVVNRLERSKTFAEINAIAPGFINITVSDEFLVQYINEMDQDEALGCNKSGKPKTIVIDYGGPNVAKPLHVGHLRSAIIGESIKRIGLFMGHKVIGDVHLGDWGLQIGLILTELKKRQPDLVYFDPAYEGDYPVEAPFSMSDLEEIYPYATMYSKENPEYKEEAQKATAELQKGNRGYQALWKHISEVSVADIKRNYQKLNVEFDLWKGESDAQPYIDDMVKYLKDKGFAYISEGALVVDVKEDTDKKEIPPCMILKSNGATLYETTDLATIIERMKLFQPDQMIYVADKRQSLHFEKVFRCAKKTKLVNEDTQLVFVGFGTMNGKDGKPFKTRDGGVLRLENLIRETSEKVYDKIMENREIPEEESRDIARKVGLAAIKYGDLSNQASKDYVFDLERFISFEGNTGPYIIYTIVRIKSVLGKFKEQGGSIVKLGCILEPYADSERGVMLQLTKFNEMMEQAYSESAPHKICQYIYDLSDAFNKFYHENKILTEENSKRKESWIQLLNLVLKVLTQCIELLGLETPERM